MQPERAEQAGANRGEPGQAETSPSDSERVPVADLINLAALGRHGRPPTPAQVRAALPVGWVLDEDGRTARRDGRILHRHSVVLITGLLFFGVAGMGLFWTTFPRGWAGVGRAVTLLVVLLVAGGWVGPAVTRALMRR